MTDSDERVSRTLLGRLWSGHRAGGATGRVWSAISLAYAGTGTLLHLVFGVFFALGLWIEPWWFVALVLAVWTAMWLPIVRLWRSRPAMVAFAVLGGDLALFFVTGAIVDAVGWM